MKSRLKKILKIAGIGLGTLFVLVTVVGFFLPTSVHVERSIVISAKPQDVYPLIADFKHGWVQWNPFQTETPDMKLAYSGPDQGVGARQAWDGESSGEGHMEITEADPTRGVTYDLRLMHDSYRLNGSLICEPAQGGTRLVWTDDIPYPKDPYRRYLGLVIKKPLGDAFEKGLAALKTKAEAKAIAGQ